MVAKRAKLSIEGNPSLTNVRVRFEVTFDRVSKYEDSGFLPANPELYEDLRCLYENYRLLVQQNSRSLTYLDEDPPESRAEDRLSEETSDAFRIKNIEMLGDEHENEKQVSKGMCDRAQAKLRKTFLKWLDTSEDCCRFNRQARDFLQKGENFEFIIRYDDPDIERLPWHEWNLFQDRDESEPTFSPFTQSIQSPPQVELECDRIRVLVILGNSEGIDIQKDRECFERIERNANARIKFLEEPNRSEIDDALWEEGWDIIAFSGHSCSKGEEGKIFLNSRGEYLSVDDLWYGLKKALSKGLRLTIFNSCDGLKIARRINDRSIPYAIVMREAITDAVAQKFLRYFLENFTTGKSLQTSVREARERLHDEQGDRVPCASWLPVILQTSSAELLYWKDLNRASPRVAVTSREHQSDGGVEHEFEIVPKEPPRKVSALKIAIASLASIVFLPIAASQLSNYAVKSGVFAFSPAGKSVLGHHSQKTSRLAFKLATILNPWNSKAHLRLGNLYDDYGDLDKAESHLKRSHLLGSGVACSNLGRLYIRRGDFQKAEEALSACRHLIPDEKYVLKAQYYKNLGWLFYEVGELGKSEKHLRNSLDIIQSQDLDNNGKSNCLLAEVLRQKGEQQEAVPHMIDCLDLASNYYPEVQKLQNEFRDFLRQGIARDRPPSP